MDIEFKFFANFREAVGDKTIQRAFEDGATVGDVLHALEDEFEGLSFFEEGELRSYVRVLKNGRDVEHLDDLETILEDGDTVSCFPPVAGGTERVERTYRGIPARLAVEYLERLGGERVGEGEIEGDGWHAEVQEDDPEKVGPTITLTPVTVRFEGEAEALDDLVERFSQKAMRAGG